jgi:hypothetical protein
MKIEPQAGETSQRQITPISQIDEISWNNQQSESKPLKPELRNSNGW